MRLRIPESSGLLRSRSNLIQTKDPAPPLDRSLAATCEGINADNHLDPACSAMASVWRLWRTTRPPRANRFSKLIFLSAMIVLFPVATGAQEGLWEKLNAQAMDLHRQNRDLEALPIARQALALAEKQFGPTGTKIATALTNLADIYRAQSRYGDAEPLYRRALGMVQQKPGPETIEAAKSLDNLGALYEAWGHYAQAEPFYQRALAVNEKVLGPESFDVAFALHNLAELYRAQGRYRSGRSKDGGHDGRPAVSGSL